VGIGTSRCSEQPTGTLNLRVDDERDPREWLYSIRWFRGRDTAELGEWFWAKIAREAIALLGGGGIDEVNLDHELGDPAEAGTGYAILLWIEQRAATEERQPPSGAPYPQRQHRRQWQDGERHRRDRPHRLRKGT